jgi:hypothetical protein
MAVATQKRGRGRPPKSIQPSRVIECGKAYPLDEFRDLTKLGYRGLRDAQSQGLRVIYVGKAAFVRGDDWHAWLGGENRCTRRFGMK